MVAHEKLAQSFRRDVGLDHRWIQPVASLSDCLLVNISREHLYFWRIVEAVGMFAQQHRNRVGFLTAGAAGYPHPHFIIFFLAGEKLRNMGRKRNERVSIAKEMCYPDQQ